MIVKLVIESPLPQLDRVFEYEVPKSLESQISFGIRVMVAIGRSKKLYLGYVVGIASEAEYHGALGSIEQIVSPVPVLTERIYDLACQLAARQASVTAEVLKSAIPNRSVAVEQGFRQPVQARPFTEIPAREPKRWALTIDAVTNEAENFQPHWLKALATIAKSDLEFGSVIVCLPTENHLKMLKTRLKQSQIPYVDYSSSQTASKRYASFLEVLAGEKQLVVGNRISLYAPAKDLQSIIIWDEFDSSHIDQSSPYLHSRDIALLRESIENVSLYFASTSISTEIERLVEIGYLEHKFESGRRPKIAYEPDVSKSETLLNKTIRRALTKGPVLVQVSAIGHSAALYCKNCQNKVHCSACSGPLWLDSAARPKCRWCNAMNLSAKCSICGSSDLRQGRAGASRSVSEFGKSFPGIQVIESTSANRVERVSEKPLIVIATPGCEPVASKGYMAIILLDARNQLSWDSLRSVEESVHAWNGAITFLHPEGEAVLVGVGGKLAEQYALWQLNEIVKDEFHERSDLRLPPAIRLASITGKSDEAKMVIEAISSLGVEVLGPTLTQNSDTQYLVKYPYKLGSELALRLKSAILKVGASKSSASGRSSRNVRIKMDDRQVI